MSSLFRSCRHTKTMQISRATANFDSQGCFFKRWNVQMACLKTVKHLTHKNLGLLQGLMSVIWLSHVERHSHKLRKSRHWKRAPEAIIHVQYFPMQTADSLMMMRTMVMARWHDDCSLLCGLFILYNAGKGGHQIDAYICLV